MNKTIKRICNWGSGILISFAVLLAIALVGVRFIGLNPYVVLSGSMEPTYHTGSVIYVMKADTSILEVGDVITFRMNGNTIATHRIIEVVEENNITSFRTKGDANDIADGSAVTASQVIGKPVFTVPYLGYLVSYIQSPSGRYAALAVGAALLLMVFLPDLLSLGNEKEKEKKE